MSDLYCDGGLIGPNPSCHGGTWAWCLIREDRVVVTQGSGVVTPDDLGTKRISNNDTELYAALRALSAIRGGRLTLHTDSKVTFHRLKGGGEQRTIPEALLPLLRDHLHRVRKKKVRVKLVAGHPTRKELRDGFSKRGVRVSRWNCRCDKICSALARRFLERRQQKAAS